MLVIAEGCLAVPTFSDGPQGISHKCYVRVLFVFGKVKAYQGTVY